MKHRFFVYITAFLSVASLSLRAREVVHSLDIAHPTITKSNQVPSLLTQVQDDQGNPLEYHMDTDSVVCGDGQCEIVKVRLWWNVLGGYERYELLLGGNLTKMGHVPFSPKDHQKLQTILSNSASELAQFPVEQVFIPTNETQEVDAVTKATPLFFQNTVVSGAVYTCYTLWYWANGDIPKKIRRLTEKSCSSELLLDYVNGGVEKLSVFGMEQLAKRGVYDQKTVAAVIACAGRGEVLLAEAAIGYFESSLGKKGGAIYYSAMELLFAKANSQKRILYLRSLTEVKTKAQANFYDRMAAWLPRLGTYYEVHLLLTLLEKRAPDLKETVKQSLIVLENENFLIARRAFWFLDKQSLAGLQMERVDAFRTKFEGRL